MTRWALSVKVPASPTVMAPSLRQHRRIAALALAALWASIPLSALLHDEAHGHRYCAEHQAFEEGAAVSSETRGGERRASGDTVTGAAQLAEADHAKCPVAHAQTRDVVPGPSATGATVFCGDAPEAIVPRTAVHPQIPPLFVAPKASPPVLAV